ncbi:MAG TPA: hypothetical protein VG496_12875 [Myxococcales bacterium]|nr:hypothetical protein [Myxococcales bacterium]
MRRSAALFFAVFSCSSPSAPPPGAAGPVEAVQEFAAALERGDAAAAYGLLSSRTQREADQIAARARTSAAGASGIPESGRQMLFGSALPSGKVEVREVSRQGDTAQVEVVDSAHHARTYRVIRDKDVWKVDLDLSSSGADAGR